MKKLWNSVMMAGLSVVLLAMCAPGAMAQGTPRSLFRGTVTLPFQVQWGSMVLPAGEYTLRYGVVNGSTYVVEVAGKEKGSPHGLILARTPNSTKATTDSLVCIREGDIAVVRDLEMPAIDRSVSFAMPNGEKLVANNRNIRGHAETAEAQLRVERIPVALNAK